MINGDLDKLYKQAEELRVKKDGGYERWLVRLGKLSLVCTQGLIDKPKSKFPFWKLCPLCDRVLEKELSRIEYGKWYVHRICQCGYEYCEVKFRSGFM